MWNSCRRVFPNTRELEQQELNKTTKPKKKTEEAIQTIGVSVERNNAGTNEKRSNDCLKCSSIGHTIPPRSLRPEAVDELPN